MINIVTFIPKLFDLAENINTILIFFRTNPPMKGAFQMLDGEKTLYS